MEASAKTAENQADAVREEILRHARELFCHYGFNKTNIGDIAKCCGMSAGNLYRYYRNKQAIGLAAVAQYFAQAEAAMEAEFVIPGGSAEERIRRFLDTGIRHIVEELDRNPKIVELAEFLCEDEQGLELLDSHIAWKRALVAREIQRGVAAGTLRDCDCERTSATLLNALKMFWMPMTLARWRDPATIMPELEDLLDLLFRGMRS
ncbi:MAG: TetR/AcrR family transcriptional regulator [Pseudomonadota bacterium]